MLRKNAGPHVNIGYCLEVITDGITQSRLLVLEVDAGECFYLK